MQTKFDQILDECITRITKGETVESCLKRYPDFAGELEPFLRIIAQTGDAYSYKPSSEAKAKGRERLYAEMRSIEKAEAEAAKSGWNLLRVITNIHIQRWAVASAAVLLIAVTSGVTTVAASQRTKPGDFLYPVKRTAENTRLALEFSSESKANLEIEYAERRANEIAKLIASGDTEKVDSTQKDLHNHLASAAKIAGNLDNEVALAKVRTNLIAAGSDSLAKIDTAVERSSPQKNAAAVQTSKEAGGSFSDAIDSVPLPQSIRATGDVKSAAVAGPISAAGTVQLYASDLPDGIEKVLIELTKVEAYLAVGSESQWVDITTSPQIIDLSRISDVRKFLGEGQVQAGSYTRVRLNISSASVSVNGSQREIKVPGSSIVINRPFKVKAGETTILQLGFNSEKSLRSSQQGELLLVPLVYLSAKEPVASTKPAEQPSASLATKPVEIEGTITDIQNNQITVLGKPIVVGAGTRIEGKIALGSKAKIRATASENGILTAVQIRASAEAVATPISPDRPRPAVTPGVAPAPTAVPTARPATVAFGGVIDSLSPGVWVISGKEILVSDNTKINGTPREGASVRIEGVIQSSGSILAGVISIAAPVVKPTETPVERKPILEQRVTLGGTLQVIDYTHWLIDSTHVSLTSQTVVEGAAVSGAKAEVLGVRQPDGSVIALKARVAALPRIEPTISRTPAATPTPSPVQLTGLIEGIREHELKVANVSVLITNTTVISGKLDRGAQVKIEGLLLKSGVISAVRITVVLPPPPTLSGTDSLAITPVPILPNPLAPTK